MNRRRFLTTSLGVAAGATALTVGVSTASAAELRGAEDWRGTFVGTNDGRAASITIRLSPGGGPGAFYPSLQFVDFAGNVWRFDNPADPFNYAYSPQLSGRQHVLRDLVLKPQGRPGGREELVWPRLYLATWDTRFLMGYGVWRGQEFGMQFMRL